MWILLVVELIAIVIFMPKLRKKVNKQQGEEEQRIHNKIDEEMENMTFQEGSEYLLKNKKEKMENTKIYNTGSKITTNKIPVMIYLFFIPATNNIKIVAIINVIAVP